MNPGPALGSQVSSSFRYTALNCLAEETDLICFQYGRKTTVSRTFSGAAAIFAPEAARAGPTDAGSEVRRKQG